MRYTPLKTVLLTGAGFTQSFGGYLASEMWAALLRQPEIQRDDGLHGRLLDVAELNFEMFYDEVENSGNYSEVQKNLVRDAIKRAYDEMDECIRSGDKPTATGVHYFLDRFAGSNEQRTRGFVFTLNQDLFQERFYAGDKDLRLAGIVTRPEWFKGDITEWKYDVELPSNEKVTQYRKKFWEREQGRLVYVKLHGSSLWKSQDGSNAMVIGYGKRGRMEKEPILAWYLEIFKEVLTAGNVNLVIIGYGFGDDYLNGLIADAVKKTHLRLHIVCPVEPSCFKQRVINAPPPEDFKNYEVLGNILWEGLATYYPVPVTYFYRPGYAALPPPAQSFFRAVHLF